MHFFQTKLVRFLRLEFWGLKYTDVPSLNELREQMYNDVYI